jgi:hypothetical protein
MKILNGSPGFGAQMTEEEVRNFLANSKLNVHIATIDDSGDPNIHPTWYYFNNNTGRIYIETSKNSKKVQNLGGKNVVYYCIDDGTIPYRGVRGKARIRISNDVNFNLPITEKIMTKYLGNLDNSMANILLNSIKNGDSVILELMPDYFSTWDYGKKK